MNFCGYCRCVWKHCWNACVYAWIHNRALTVCSVPFCREFARWKVRNTAIERRDLIRNPLPLMPDFQRSMRMLGRRPSTQQFIDTIIKKYGTHILISATLGGERCHWHTVCISMTLWIYIEWRLNLIETEEEHWHFLQPDHSNLAKCTF